MKSIKLANCFLLGSIVALAGCEAPETIEDICRANCQVGIDLPEDSKRPPNASPERMVIAAGEYVNFVVEGGPPGQEATVLRFERPNTPLLDDNENPLYTAELKRGSNRFRTRPWEDGVCRPPDAPDGCKYDIVNTGNSQRPPKDPWIILAR